MKNASYKQACINLAVKWIAINDDPEEIAHENIKSMTSVLLIADVFNKPASEIADRVLEHRINVKLENEQ